MASTTGGSGKQYNTSKDGSITVKRPDGSSSTVAPGSSAYEKTKDAMNSDTGSGKYAGSGSSSSSSGSSSSSSSSGSSSSSSGSSSSGSSNSPSNTKVPEYWKPGAGDDATLHTAVIKDSNGKTVATHQTYIKDGAMYDATTGQILSSNHGVQGVYGDPLEYVKVYDSATGVGTWTAKPKPTSSSPSYSSPSNDYYSPPPRPSFVNFNEPIPTFKSDLKKVNKYTYFSGIDTIEAKRIDTNPEVCFISKTITIGDLKDNEYIELFAQYFAGDNASIEFYIIDGEREIPILPINDITVQNEKIFFALDTRFPIDETKEVVIKQGERITNLSFNEAREKATNTKMENTYNISYTPKTSYKYKPLNPTIKIKAILRAYAINNYAPYIKALKIRKYGGNALWNQDI